MRPALYSLSAFKLAFVAARLLPRRAAHGLAARIGHWAYVRRPESQQALRENLGVVTGKSGGDLDAVCAANVGNFSRMLADYFHCAGGGAAKSLLEHWARTLGMHGAYAAAFDRGGEEFGNALLTRWPILEQHAHDASLHGYRRRVVLEALVTVAGVKLQLMSLHLGVSPRERWLQAQQLFELCSATLTRGLSPAFSATFCTSDWSPLAVTRIS